MRTSAALLALALTAPAHALDTERLSLGLPAEVALVGLSFGVHPELLFRPLQPDGALHLRLAPGLLVGPELANLPIAIGVREVALPRKAVRPYAGLGLTLQSFVPYGHPAKARGDLYMELGCDVRVSDRARVGLNLSPEFGMIGGFGLGMAARVGPELRF